MHTKHTGTEAGTNHVRLLAVTATPSLGDGLFATRDLAEGEVITHFLGAWMPTGWVWERNRWLPPQLQLDQQTYDPFVFHFKELKCVDFVLAYCPAMIINSPGNRDEKGEVCFAATNNCAFVAGRLSDEEVNLSQKYNSKYSIDVVCTKAVKKV